MRLFSMARPLYRAAFLVATLAVIAGTALAQNAPVTVTIDVAAKRRTISPLIYGMNYAGGQLKDLNCPIHRLGGNNMSRYNWKLNADNRGGDWFFESLPDSSTTPNQRYFSFVDDNKASGAHSIVTVPTLNWVAKLGPNRGRLSSFPVSKYGVQQYTDYWFPDAGNGVRTNGTLITGNDPADANTPSDVAFQQGFVNSLIARYGRAASGGVRYYALDNEPSLWFSTHRDVQPTGATMEEVRNKITAYGKMIKAQDPDAMICAPEEWGWSGYLFSGYDQQYGSLHGWWPLPDYIAHNYMYYVPYLLQSLKADEQTTGKRSIDVLSLHYYPQGGEYSDDVSTNMQLLRNRSTRSLWDPGYTDYSWINDKVNLINRMRDWVNTYYPGLKLALTEYCWGADNYASGAIAQADLFGIFGREGLDIATRWVMPPVNSPTYNAIKMYRNYDGLRSSFGDVSVSATGFNPDTLAVYASQDTRTGTLKIMLISKVLSGNTSVTLNSANFNASGFPQVFQWTGATNKIRRVADLTSATIDLPPQSITLIVAPGR